MNIALGTIIILFGLIALGAGCGLFAAAMHSDNEVAGAEVSSRGCMLALGGVAAMAFGIWLV